MDRFIFIWFVFLNIYNHTSCLYYTQLYKHTYLLELLQVGVAGDLGQRHQHEGGLVEHLNVFMVW